MFRTPTILLISLSAVIASGIGDAKARKQGGTAPTYSTSNEKSAAKIGPDTIQHKHIGGVKYENVPTQPTNTTTPKYDLKKNQKY